MELDRDTKPARREEQGDTAPPANIRESAPGPPPPARADGAPGLVIPGYQPVEKLGSAPSFGIWLRALQTRMDRRVLLKLLPPGLPTTHEYFAREISTLVRLDGAGVLRVIDEGSAEGVRYLVSDEAASKPLSDDRASYDETLWLQLARTLENLFHQLGEWNLVLLPVAPGAFRRLPSGDFALADLGYLLPIGSPLPEHPSIPESLRGTPAQPWLNARFLGLTLKNLSALPGKEPPRAWRKQVTELAALELNPENPNPLALGIFEMPAPSSRRVSSRQVVALVGALLCLGTMTSFAAWKLFFENRGADRRPAVTNLDGSNADGTNVDGANAGTGSHTGTASRHPGYVPPAESELEKGAREAIAKLAGGADAESEDPFLAVTPQIRAQLIEWLRKNPQSVDTAAGKRARRWIAYSELEEEARIWRQFDEQLRRVLAFLEDGRVANAEEEIAILEKNPPALVRDEIAYLRLMLEDDTRGRVAALDAQTQQLRAERRYEEAVQLLLGSHARLSRSGVIWAESEREKIAGERRRFAEARTRQRAAIDGILELTARGEWSSAKDRLTGDLAPEEFGELREQGTRWLAWATQAERAARALCQVLSGYKNKVLSLRAFRAAAGEPPAECSLRGTVVEDQENPILPWQFTLKKEGLQGPSARLRINFSELHLGTLAELVPSASEVVTDAVKMDDWALMLFFLGDSARARKIAEQATPPPPWREEVEELFARLAKRDFDALLTSARSAAGKSDWVTARSTYLDLAKRFPKEWLTPCEEECREWLNQYWRSEPLRAFPSATPSSKKEQKSSFDGWGSGSIHLVYDLGDTPRDRIEPHLDWERAPGPNNQKVKQKEQEFLNLRGLLIFRPAGCTDLAMFERELEVVVRIRPVPGEKGKDFSPNLNVVLWVNTLDGGTGLLFGAGWRPPGVPSVTIGPDIFLLPAHVIGELPLVEQPDPNAFHARPTLRPALDPKAAGDFYTLKVSSGAANAFMELWLGSSKRLVMTGDGGRVLPEAARRGTVAIQTYSSLVHIQSVEITGKLRREWVEAWAKAHAEEDLR